MCNSKALLSKGFSLKIYSLSILWKHSTLVPLSLQHLNGFFGIARECSISKLFLLKTININDDVCRFAGVALFYKLYIPDKRL